MAALLQPQNASKSSKISVNHPPAHLHHDIPKEEEVKDSPSNIPSETFPVVFDPKWNTEHIDWNELYHLSIHKGRVLFAERLIRQHFSNELADYNLQRNTLNIKSVPPSICDFIHLILSETAIVLQSHRMLHSHRNWETQVDDSEGISIYYRAEDTANGIHSIKAKFTSTCHPVDFIAVINEFDLIPEIITMIPVETRYLKEYTEINKVLYIKMKLWFPFKNRDAV